MIKLDIVNNYPFFSFSMKKSGNSENCWSLFSAVGTSKALAAKQSAGVGAKTAGATAVTRTILVGANAMGADFKFSVGAKGGGAVKGAGESTEGAASGVMSGAGIVRTPVEKKEKKHSASPQKTYGLKIVHHSMPLGRFPGKAHRY